MKRGVSTKVSMSTGVTLWRSVQSPGQLPAHEREDVRAQVRDDDPGQDQEPRVVDDKGQILFPQFRRPFDSMNRSRGASLRAAVLKPSMAMGRSYRSWTA